jgi:LacI family transcriptional regulator
MRDVAELAGVGLGTVSNALHRPHLLSPATLERVRSAIETLQFVPDARASALAGGTSTTIGFVVVVLANSFFLDMTRGAEREAAEHGMSVLLANADMQQDKQSFYLELFDQERVAGVLLAPTHRSPVPPAAGPWSREVVVLNRDADGERCCVTVDDEAGGYRATRHLIDTGRRRLLFAGGPLFLEPVRDRLRGAERAVAETGGAVTLEHVPTAGVRTPQGREVGEAVAAMPRAEAPDGIVAAADLLAVGIVSALVARGVRVGPDVAVIGYDDNREAWDTPVPLTTMAQPGEEMGRVATRLLLDDVAAAGDHEHRHVVLDSTLVVRASTSR